MGKQGAFGVAAYFKICSTNSFTFFTGAILMSDILVIFFAEGITANSNPIFYCLFYLVPSIQSARNFGHWDLI